MTSYEKAEDWKHYYFWGISATRPAELQFSAEQIQALLSAVRADCSIASLAALEPKHVINHKGTTAWILLYVYALVNDKEGLAAVSAGTSSLFLPADIVHGSFTSHVNWPAQLLDSYGFDFGEHWAFVIPFVRHRESPEPVQMSQSLRSPDGAMEIMGIAQLNEQKPEALLAQFHEFYEQYGSRYKKPIASTKNFFQKLFDRSLENNHA